MYYWGYTTQGEKKTPVVGTSPRTWVISRTWRQPLKMYPPGNIQNTLEIYGFHKEQIYKLVDLPYLWCMFTGWWGFCHGSRKPDAGLLDL